MGGMTRRSGRDWTDSERLVILDDYLQSLSSKRSLGASWTHHTAGFLNRTYGSVNYKLGNFIYARTEVLRLPKAGFKGRAERDKQLFEEWYRIPLQLHGYAAEVRATLGERLIEPISRLRSTRVTFYQWLKGANKEDLVGASSARHEAARRLEVEGRTSFRGGAKKREGQSEFKEGALIDFVLEVGWPGLVRCPGCGHSRTRMNGDPILEVHHLIPFSRTLAMDPRWGIPLCNNCHEVAHTGTIADQKEVMINVLRVFPNLPSRLQALRDEGKLTISQIDELRSMGVEVIGRTVSGIEHHDEQTQKL
jgi:hypothetical protein